MPAIPETNSPDATNEPVRTIVRTEIQSFILRMGPIPSPDVLRKYEEIACGFVVAMTSILGGIYLINNGHDTAGTVLVTGSLVGLVGVFVYGTKSGRKERIIKASSPIGTGNLDAEANQIIKSKEG
jgi:hypothetical protein